MNWLKRLIRAGVCDPGFSPRTPLSNTERLESRMLFAGGPSLVGEALLGSAEGVTGIVLTFNQHLDPATAQNVDSYGIGRHPPRGSSGGGLLGGLGGLFPLVEHPGQEARPAGLVLHPDRRGVHGGKIAFTSAVYDDATMSVTLTPAYPIKATKFFRFVHISGTGNSAVTNTLGQPVIGNDGGVGNIRVVFKPRQGKTVRFTDANGNRVILTLKGPGTIVAFLRTGPIPDPLVLLENTIASKSILTGTVKPAPGNGDFTDLQELLGTSNSNATAVTSNAEFNIAAIEP